MLSKFSVKKPYTVIVGLVLIVVLGIVSFQRINHIYCRTLIFPML